MKILNINLIHRYWRDLLLGILLGVTFSCAVYQGAKLVPSVIFEHTKYCDVWFGSDTPRVYDNMTDQYSGHYRTEVHPLFSLTAHPAVFLAKKAFNLRPAAAVRLVISLMASLWIFFLFMLLRLLGCKKLDATLFSLLAAVSAASVFWFVVPETYPFGSLSILLALLVVTLPYQNMLGYIFINVLTLSFTLTNWMAGIFATIVMNRPFRRALEIMAYAFCIVTLLWGVEKHIYPSAQFFLGSNEELKYTLLPETGSPVCVARSFFYHSLIMPFINTSIEEPMTFMGTQFSNPGNGTPLGMGAVILWTIILGLGIWALFFSKKNAKFRIVLGLTLLGQLGLHIVYGDQTFLYSLHFIILLVLLAALGSLTRFRYLIIGLMLILIPLVGINNFLQFNKAVNYEGKLPQQVSQISQS